MNSEICQLDIKTLLQGDVDYVIPMYQRNYAWEEGEITQLIQDMIDCLGSRGNYYIGTLVVYERPDKKFETIDGQQRLTTLSLLASYLKKIKAIDASCYPKLCIDFDSRLASRETLRAISEGGFQNDPARGLKEDEVNPGIRNGYLLIQRILPQLLRENGRCVNLFARFLFNRAKILRVNVPQDTDLNHYFEIMNSRGEQLEKHEVLKARMMEKLKDCKESQHCLHVVWEACANMERYVQVGFTPDQRTRVFGSKDWGSFNVTDFDKLRAALNDEQKTGAEQDSSLTLNDIIAQAPATAGHIEGNNDAPERFNTVINFSNFLLHVLRVHTKKDIPLDDKRLLETFAEHISESANPAQAVKEFIFSLLRCKYLFDKYVIKREFIKGADGWSLKRLTRNDGGEHSQGSRVNYVNTFGDEEDNNFINRRILILLSAFHVSTPTLAYKHWLNAALRYLFYACEIKACSYLQHMESVAMSFIFDRFLAQGNGLDYFEMIYQNEGEPQTDRKNIPGDVLQTALTFGNIQNNLVFNFLDYLLWLQHRSTEPVKSYEFTFRSSVEHYYPQHPLPGHPKLDDKPLNSFGNLCLISHEKNSRLSNYMPDAKKNHYQSGAMDSVKQYLMMEFELWDANAIEQHYEQMFKVLRSGPSAN